MIKQKTVNVSEGADKIAQALVSIVKSAKEHTKDGFQAGQDVPAVLVENLQGILGSVAEFSKLPEEAKESKSAFTRAWMLMGTDIEAILFDEAV